MNKAIRIEEIRINKAYDIFSAKESIYSDIYIREYKYI